MRREWIEIEFGKCIYGFDKCLPPCGGSGLKFSQLKYIYSLSVSPSMRREWIEMVDVEFNPKGFVGLPPCGVSGLKYKMKYNVLKTRKVSLHAEGVD